MDISNVSRFLAVMEHKSFAKAARALGITPQAVAFSIKKLEQELGVSLFAREPGGLTAPTEYAHLLERHARSLVVSERRAFDAVRSLREARSGWLRLGIGETMTGNALVPLLSDILAERPDVRIAIIEDYTDILLDRMERGELDLIAGSPVTTLGHAENLTQQVLFESSDVIVARQEHPLAGKPHVSLADMQSFAWIVPYSRRDAHEAVVSAFLNEGLEPPTSFIFSDAPIFGTKLIHEGDFLLLSPRDMAQTDGAGKLVQIIADTPSLERTACLIYPSNRPLSEIANYACDRILALSGKPSTRRKAS